MMKRCAFLSTEDLTGHVTDDHLSVEPFLERGWEVEPVAWRSRADWARFDAVVIRTPWDYQNEPDAFLGVLEEIDRTGTPLANPLELVRWNVSKKYLLDLERVGVRVVPTIFQRSSSSSRRSTSGRIRFPQGDSQRRSAMDRFRREVSPPEEGNWVESVSLTPRCPRHSIPS